jgi:Holliday junction resolvase RusA-like endonuclease
MLRAIDGVGACPAGVPLHVAIEAVWPQPTSAPKRDWSLRRYRPSRPDSDNVGKAVLDAGNGILWHDDAQVVVLHVVKVTGAHGEEPRVTVVVRAMDPALSVLPA